MTKKCSHCGANAVEVDEEGKLEVCSNCGVVCNEGSYQSDAKFHNQQTFTTQCFGNKEENWRIKSQHRVVSRNLLNSKKYLEGQAERLRLPKEYITQAYEKLKTIYEEKLFKGLPRNRKAIVGSCVYIVCRQNDMVVTLNNVSEAARCDMSVLARCARKLTKAMNIQLDSLEPDQVITNVLSQFKIQDPSTKKLVSDLFQFCDKTLICSGKKMILTVMALVYMSIESVNGSPVSAKQLREVCRLNTIRAEHVHRFVRQYRSELLKFAQKIPWVRPNVTTRQVPKFLKEILDYYKDCEDYRKVGFKPKWQIKKDLEEKEKMQKIEKAEKRLGACQQRCGDTANVDDRLCLHENCKPTSTNLVQNSNIQHSGSASSKATTSPTESDHICCPHCCIKKPACPVFQENGMSDFCKLDKHDRIVEWLLRKGYSKQELMKGTPESIFYSENYNSDSELEKEELDEGDIPDQDIHIYIKNDYEVVQADVLQNKSSS